jgi:hypothetical protein
MKRINLIVLFMLTLGLVYAQDTEKTNKRNIFKVLAAADSASGATVKIHQDKRIEQVVTDRKSPASQHATITAAGYRVQVFSSNTQRTAKSEAFKIEKELRDVFPEYAVYVNYTSPFWKVRVGDFRTMQEAQEFRAELIKIFPNLKSETYTVRDQVNL